MKTVKLKEWYIKGYAVFITVYTILSYYYPTFFRSFDLSYFTQNLELPLIPLLLMIVTVILILINNLLGGVIISIAIFIAWLPLSSITIADIPWAVIDGLFLYLFWFDKESKRLFKL